MSHNVNSNLYHIQTSLICSAEAFALITVIDRLVQRVVHFLLHSKRHPNYHSGSGFGFVSIFFFLHNLVNFARRDMCDTSMKSCAHWLYFEHCV